MTFVLWLLGWPLVTSICEYLGAKRRLLDGTPPLSKAARDGGAMVSLLIWIVVGVIVYFARK